jgi:hypothetical protein
VLAASVRPAGTGIWCAIDGSSEVSFSVAPYFWRYSTGSVLTMPRLMSLCSILTSGASHWMMRFFGLV